MEKLELKHIAGYLPNGLNIEFERCIYPRRKEKEVLNPKHLELSFYGIKNNFKIKPILRPLSDLTKEIEVNGEKFVPIEKLAVHLFDFDFIDYVVVKKETNGIPFWVIQKLYEWHFDIHGLIEKGLAIDLNMINNGIQ